MLGTVAASEGFCTSHIVARISDLNQTLAINRFVLRRHLSAAQEISEILTNAVRAAESDGTYTMDGRLLVPVR